MGQKSPMGSCASRLLFPRLYQPKNSQQAEENGDFFLTVVCWDTVFSLAPWYKNDMDIFK